MGICAEPTDDVVGVFSSCGRWGAPRGREARCRVRQRASYETRDREQDGKRDGDWEEESKAESEAGNEVRSSTCLKSDIEVLRGN